MPVVKHIKVEKDDHRDRKLAWHVEEKYEKGCTKIKQKVEKDHRLNDDCIKLRDSRFPSICH